MHRNHKLSGVAVSAVVACLVVGIVAPQIVWAQVEARNPVLSALGGGGPAIADGPSALFFNPAGIDRTRGMTVSVGHIGIFAGGPLLEFSHYNRAFVSGDPISHSEARSIVRDWFGDPSLSSLKSAGVEAVATPLAITWTGQRSAFGAGIRTRALGRVGVNGGWLDLLLVGMEEDRVLPLNARSSFMTSTDVGGAVAFKVRDRLRFGVGPRVVLGSEYVDFRISSTADISNQSILHSYDYEIRSAGGITQDLVDEISLFQKGVLGNATFGPSPLDVAGIGFGTDVGLDYDYSDKVNIAASITDIGFVRWTKNAARRTPAQNEFVFDGIEFDPQTISSEFGGRIGDYLESKLDSLARAAYEETVRVDGAFTSALPAAIHAGGAWRLLDGKARIAAGSSVGVNRQPGNTSPNPSLHVGGEYRVGGRVGLPVRGGIQVGGSGAMTLGFGFGVHAGPYAFDVGVAGTPYSDIVGGGGRYSVAVSLATIRL